MAPPTDYTINEISGVSFVKLEIESLMAGMEVGRLGAELEALVGNGVRKMVLDLTRVRYASSAALGMLMGLQKRLRDAGGKLVLMNLPAQIEQLLKVARAGRLFQVATGPEAAIERFDK